MSGVTRDLKCWRSLLDFFLHHVEQVVVLDALDQLRFIVHREVRCDGAGELRRSLRLVDQRRHGNKLPDLGRRCESSLRTRAEIPRV